MEHKHTNCLPDEGVDLGSLNIIETLDGILDLVLVGLNVNEESQGVVFLNLLHGSLGVERLTNDTVLIHAGSMSNRLASVLGGTAQNQSLGDVEVGRGTDLANSLTVDTLEGGLLGGLSLSLGSYVIYMCLVGFVELRHKENEWTRMAAVGRWCSSVFSTVDISLWIAVVFVLSSI